MLLELLAENLKCFYLIYFLAYFNAYKRETFFNNMVSRFYLRIPNEEYGLIWNLGAKV